MGSDRKTQSPIECVKGIKFRRNYGKSPALYCGFQAGEGDVVITMDADLLHRQSGRNAGTLPYDHGRGL